MFSTPSTALHDANSVASATPLTRAVCAALARVAGVAGANTHGEGDSQPPHWVRSRGTWRTKRGTKARQEASYAIAAGIVRVRMGGGCGGNCRCGSRCRSGSDIGIEASGGGKPAIGGRRGIPTLCATALNNSAILTNNVVELYGCQACNNGDEDDEEEEEQFQEDQFQVPAGQTATQPSPPAGPPPGWQPSPPAGPPPGWRPSPPPLGSTWQPSAPAGPTWQRSEDRSLWDQWNSAEPAGQQQSQAPQQQSQGLPPSQVSQGSPASELQRLLRQSLNETWTYMQQKYIQQHVPQPRNPKHLPTAPNEQQADVDGTLKPVLPASVVQEGPAQASQESQERPLTEEARSRTARTRASFTRTTIPTQPAPL